MQLETFDDIEPFFASIEKETDRACAVLACVLLDELLADLLQRVMIEDAPSAIFKRGPLSDFSAKIDAAYYFGHLSRDEYEELGHIRKVRNEFAHRLDPDLTFESPSIRDFSFALKLPEFNIATVGLEHGAVPIEMRRYLTNPRDAFVLSLRLMVGLIQRRAREYERPEEQGSFKSILVSLNHHFTLRQRYGDLANEFEES